MKQNFSALIALLFLSAILAGSMFAQGSVLLVGGGSEDYGDWSDQPYRWLVDHAPTKVVLVMHYSDGSAWLESYFRSFGATSATSLVISTKAAANDSANFRAILAASGVFLRGGYRFGYDTETGTFGAGALASLGGSTVVFDYSYSLYNLLPNVHRVSVGLRF